MKSILAVVYSCAIGVSCVCAQTSGGAAGQSNSSMSGGKWSSYGPSNARTMVSGTVKMDDGSPLPVAVSIQLICGGREMTVAQSNVLNDFGFQMRATGETGTPGPGTSYNLLSGASLDAAGVRGSIPTAMGSCDLRAELAGYRSSSIHLNPSAFEAFNVGTIWLHRMEKSGASMVTISTLAAPKDAVKQFEKGQELARISKLAEAAACLRKAVSIDPGFAEAWLYLGTIQYKMGAMEDAEASLLRARDIDQKLAGVYLMLGYMAYDRREWNATVRFLDHAAHLQPRRSALAWYTSAVANFELQRLDEAEQNIREEMKLDPRLQIPRATYLLGLVLIRKGDSYGGTQAIRDYLAASPDPRDVENAKRILTRTELLAGK